jgi:hypothetical protein
MKTLKKIGIVAAAALIGSCVDPFDVPKINFVPQLAVDATITDETGPHNVTLTYTSKLSNDYSNRVFVSGAIVRIKDETADITTGLVETSPGKYQTPANWSVVIGREYTLHIQLADGREFRSDTQKVKPAGEIDTLQLVYLPNSINQDDAAQPQNALGIYIDSRGIAGESNFFRWRWTGTYEVETDPASKTRIDPDCMCEVPDPPACSFGLCSCCICWVNDFSSRAMVSNNQLSTDNAFYNVFLGKIPIEPFRFFKKYHIEIEQLSLSESAYQFWKLVQAQQQGATDIFQPNAIKIRGNIQAVTNPNDEVFGVVSFSAVAKASRFIYRHELPVTILEPPLIREDCRIVFRRATNVKPDFW